MWRSLLLMCAAVCVAACSGVTEPSNASWYARYRLQAIDRFAFAGAPATTRSAPWEEVYVEGSCGSHFRVDSAVLVLASSQSLGTNDPRSGARFTEYGQNEAGDAFPCPARTMLQWDGFFAASGDSIAFLGTDGLAYHFAFARRSGAALSAWRDQSSASDVYRLVRE